MYVRTSICSFLDETIRRQKNGVCVTTAIPDITLPIGLQSPFSADLCGANLSRWENTSTIGDKSSSSNDICIIEAEGGKKRRDIYIYIYLRDPARSIYNKQEGQNKTKGPVRVVEAIPLLIDNKRNKKVCVRHQNHKQDGVAYDC